MNNFVSTNWVYKSIHNKNICIFDCSWHMPSTNIKPYIEYRKTHIKKANFFDIDNISDNNTSLPHMAPSKKLFEKQMQLFGINNNTKVILYDTIGIFSSPRVWWLFKYFGHKNVFVMNGGLKKWIKEKKPVTNNIETNNKGNFKAKICDKFLINRYELFRNINNKKLLILDARNNLRFKGLEKEPRKGLRSGHIPNSKNLYWADLINKNGTIKSKNILKKIFNKYSINRTNNIVTTCGSGITACILSIALSHSYNYNTKVYDGSWCEWGRNKKYPISK